MITPVFELSQDDKFLIVIINAPYTKISDTEIEFFDNEFRFYSKPYFLRLILPGNVTENGEESANYDSDTGSYTVKVPKLVEGEVFEGLDFQTKLLAKRKPAYKSPVIEVLGENNLEQEDEFCWDIIQNQYTEDENEVTEESHYGFANQKSGVFNKLRDEIPDLVDVKDADKKTVYQRKTEKIELEQKEFNDDHYLADLYQDTEVKTVLEFVPYFVELYNKNEKEVRFTNSEIERMTSLPNREYLLDHSLKQKVLLSVVDILLAYCYNFRTTEGENTVASAWTITKLSSTLCWLDSFSSLDSVAMSFMRRSLCYPLHRNFELSKAVIKDTTTILSLGTKMVLKCFLDIHLLFNTSDPHYLLNELYITDTCVWMQSLKSSVFINMAEALNKVSIEKCDVGLELLELEEAARLALDEDNKQEEEITTNMDQLKLENGDKSVQVDESSSEESTDSDDSSSSSQTDSEIDSDDDSDSASHSSDYEGDGLIFAKDEQCHERKR